MLPKPLLALLLALASPTPGLHALYAQTATADRRTYGTATCRVEAPVQWSTGPIAWTGGCKHGFAEGLGTLRKTIQGSPAELFLGRVQQGNLRSGVLDTPQGYTAGQWTSGSVMPAGGDDQASRNALLAAFNDGAKAAEATAKVLARHRNAKAAHFYTQLAARLHSQLD